MYKRQVIAFGTIMIIQKIDEKKEILNGLLQKYFGDMKPDKDYRGITKQELNQTSVYRFKIKKWSGKRTQHVGSNIHQPASCCCFFFR